MVKRITSNDKITGSIPVRGKRFIFCFLLTFGNLSNFCQVDLGALAISFNFGFTGGQIRGMDLSGAKCSFPTGVYSAACDFSTGQQNVTFLFMVLITIPKTFRYTFQGHTVQGKRSCHRKIRSNFKREFGVARKPSGNHASICSSTTMTGPDETDLSISSIHFIHHKLYSKTQGKNQRCLCVRPYPHYQPIFCLFAGMPSQLNLNERLM